MPPSANPIARFFRWFFLRFLVHVLALIGLLVVILGVVVGIIALQVDSPVGLPDRLILEMDLGRGLVEYVPQDPIAQALALRREPVTVRQTVEALERGAADRRVLGLVAKTDAAPLGMAVIQELRDGIAAFAASGKFTVAYAESFGEFGPGNGAYYLATAFDDIYLQPSGDIGLTGLMYESPFVRGALDKLHIQPRMGQRHQYKNAANMFTEKGFTPAHREAVESLIKAQFQQMVEGIAQRRQLRHSAVLDLVDQGPLSAHQAADNRLVDGLLYRDEVYKRIRGQAPDAELLYLHKYHQRAGSPHASGPIIALIYGIGQVHRGSSQYDPLSGDVSMGSSSLTAAFRTATADPRVQAIVFRIDSPGGSYVASDAIYRAVEVARRAGKPVIASMGNVAASGGYFVAINADRIVAQPGTITGSIGVLAGKMVTRRFWEKHLGITWDEAYTSGNANLWSGLYDYSPAQQQQLDALLDRIYDDFTAKVANGRGMEQTAVHEVAKGRIWSGAQAYEHGLVDALGGFDVALNLARQAAGLDMDTPVTLAVYPRPKELVETLLELEDSPDNSEQGTGTVLRSQLWEAVAPAYRAAVEAGLFEEGAALRMAPLHTPW